MLISGDLSHAGANTCSSWRHHVTWLSLLLFVSNPRVFLIDCCLYRLGQKWWQHWVITADFDSILFDNSHGTKSQTRTSFSRILHFIQEIIIYYTATLTVLFVLVQPGQWTCSLWTVILRHSWFKTDYLSVVINSVVRIMS